MATPVTTAPTTIKADIPSDAAGSDEKQSMLDYSSNVTVINESDFTMTVLEANSIDGTWASYPESIASHGTGHFVLKDKLGFFGSQGYVRYEVKGNSYQLNFSCKTLTANTAYWNNPNLPTPVFNESDNPLFAKCVFRIPNGN